MPLDPLENMPASLAINKLSENHHGVKLSRLASHNSSVQPIPNGNIDNTNGPLQRPLSETLVENSRKLVQVHTLLSNLVISAIHIITYLFVNCDPS